MTDTYRMAIPRHRAFTVGFLFIWHGLLAYLRREPHVELEFGMEIIP